MAPSELPARQRQEQKLIELQNAISAAQKPREPVKELLSPEIIREQSLKDLGV